MTPARVKALVFTLTLILAGALMPSEAKAGPSASGSISTDRGASGDSSGSGFDWPELVVGGNAISFISPFQIGAVGYLPKARFAFQYDRQIRRAHWIFVGIGLLADRGGFKNFRMDDCGLQQTMGLCGKGGVVGVDIYAGYAHKFFIQKKPYIVPIVRGAIGYSFFALPKIGGSREQLRTKSWTLNVRPGGGIRVFLLQQLAVGADINIPIGFLRHTEEPDDGSGDEDKSSGFLLGFEILPLIVEYRF